MIEFVTIVSQSWPIACMVIGLGIGFGILFSTYRATRIDPLQHQENMIKLETEHRERMLKINREQPKLVDGTKVSVIDNG